MKNLKLKIAMAAVVAAVAGYVTYQNQTKEIGMSELALANVEALAQNEGGNFEYPTGKPYVFACGVKTGVFQHCQAMIVTCQGGGSGCNSRTCPMHG